MKVTFNELKPRDWFIFENNLHGRIEKTLHCITYIHYRGMKDQIHTIYYENLEDFHNHNFKITTFSYGDNVNLVKINSPQDFFRK